MATAAPAKAAPPDPATADAPLAPGPVPLDPPEPAREALPSAFVAAALAERLQAAPRGVLLFVAASERRAGEIARALRRFAPEAEVLAPPAWDCLPFDRASPSREVMGRRMAAFARLNRRASGPRAVVASVEALIQRAPPKSAFAHARLRLKTGGRLDRSAVEAFARRTGYLVDEQADEPGEIAFLGEVIDVFPPACDQALRIVADPERPDRIAELRLYDPLSQRSADTVEVMEIGPASEIVSDDDEAIERTPGAEHRAPAHYGQMPSLFEVLGTATILGDEGAQARGLDLIVQVEAARAAHIQFEPAGAPPPLEADALYLSAQTWSQAVEALQTITADPAPEPITNFALAANPGRAFCDAVREGPEAGRRVILTGLEHERRALLRALDRGLALKVPLAASWAAALAAGPGEVMAFDADLEAGFTDVTRGVMVVAASDVLGGRMAARGGGNAEALLEAPDLRVGDVVVHEDHGLGVIEALETVEVDGRVGDAVRLGYYGGAVLLVPVEDFGKLWRYGAEPEAVSLDRLHTDAWRRRRAELDAEIAETAAHLVEAARARDAEVTEPIRPPRGPFARFCARFPFPETPDQARAIQKVLADLEGERPMNRLVCGDVGFGKTEVALRAAAAVALAGRQVAVVAPTTVLARQHYETFRRRFAGFDLPIALLSRQVSPAEAKATRGDVRAGRVRIVIGTHAVASEEVGFDDLALMIIDEEQRFGAALKARLKAFSPSAHRLTLSATPIPRTLRLAMAGVEEVSVIATPPARRRPIRTFVAPFDAASVRTALMRERRRGGQSFVVVPRIEDIAAMRARLAEITPELDLTVAHGGLDPEAIDEAMVGFAAGAGDVLLATSLIESGLDVPRANTMIVWRPERFGLAQLHQLRGRVGRGRAQAAAYLLTHPEDPAGEAAMARLSTLEAFDRLGSGFAISARDLELRGAGEIVGEAQAGHVSLIGAALHQHLLARALHIARGERAGPASPPELKLSAVGAIPEDYVAEPAVRLNLYARLARLESPQAVDEFAEELDDRFGPLPEAAETLLDLARARALAASLNVTRVEAGPKAVALTFEGPPSQDLESLGLSPSPQVKAERLVWAQSAEGGDAQLALALRLLGALAAKAQA